MRAEEAFSCQHARSLGPSEEVQREVLPKKIREHIVDSAKAGDKKQFQK